MKTHATGTFDIKNWDEPPAKEVANGQKFARATVTAAYQGDIEGETTLEYLLFYYNDSAHFTGYEQIVGRIGNRSGSFVLQHNGVFEDGVARSTSTVIPGSGTGDLLGIRGKGGYEAGHNVPATFTLDYEIV